MRVRPPVQADAQAVTDLVVAFDVDEFGAPDFESTPSTAGYRALLRGQPARAAVRALRPVGGSQHQARRVNPSLWFLAFAGDELAGCIVCLDYESEGWVRQLAVARGWRGRGLGLALLHQAFGEFHRRGRPHAALVVDSWNRTGARRFYERAGMRVKREHTRFEKELRAAL